MEIILLAGKAGVGKTTAAKTIAGVAFDNGFTPVLESFAKPIKEAAKEKGWDKETYPEDYRQFCQDMGARARADNPDHWVELMETRLKDLLIAEREDFNAGKKFWERVVIIDDCRYMNEIDLGHKANATLVFLSYGKRKLGEADWRSHESERLANAIESGDIELADNFPWIIANDTTEKRFIDCIKRQAPYWCGLSVSEEFDPSMHDIDDWKLYKDNTHLEEAVEELLDLLDFKFENGNFTTDLDDEELDDEETK